MERTVLITGASSGIGRATAEAFLAEDWTVVATARDEGDIEGLAEAGCLTAELDVTKPAQCQEVVDWAVEETGQIDCLVNNAGYAQFGPLEDVPPRDLHRQFDVNVYGPHRLIRAVLPHMREAESGTIVNVSSVTGRLSTPGMGAYSASKFALEAMSDALRGEVDTFGVDVVVVQPGSVETQFDERANAELADIDRNPVYESIYEAYEDARALGGLGSSTPEEVADVILEAGLSTNPRSRYQVGPVAGYAVLARFVPDRFRDAAFRLLRRLA
jgi:NAD(P)-dependent dehydrogenase (short-subunit alcohol dehydrogenase family)